MLMLVEDAGSAVQRIRILSGRGRLLVLEPRAHASACVAVTSMSAIHDNCTDWSHVAFSV